MPSGTIQYQFKQDPTDLPTTNSFPLLQRWQITRSRAKSASIARALATNGSPGRMAYQWVRVVLRTGPTNSNPPFYHWSVPTV